MEILKLTPWGIRLQGPRPPDALSVSGKTGAEDTQAFTFRSCKIVMVVVEAQSRRQL